MTRPHRIIALACAMAMIIRAHIALAGPISLPAKLSALTGHDVSFDLGMLHFSGFAVTDATDSSLADKITVTGIYSATRAEISFTPDAAGLAAHGNNTLASISLFYLVTPLDPNKTVASVDIGIIGEATGDATAGNQVILSDQSPGLSDTIGNLFAYIDGLYGEQLTDASALPAAIRQVGASATLSAETFTDGGVASLLGATHAFVASVPEPSTLSMGATGLAMLMLGLRRHTKRSDQQLLACSWLAPNETQQTADHLGIDSRQCRCSGP